MTTPGDKLIELDPEDFEQWALLNGVVHAKSMTVPWPDQPEKQALRLVEIVSEVGCLLNLVGKPGTIETTPMVVKGSMTDPRRNLIPGIGALIVGDDWTHTGFRLAFGDQESDVKFREYLKMVQTDGTDGVQRLARWMTPSGMIEAARIRRRPKAEWYQKHPELKVLDHYYGRFEASRDSAV
jgi:hypothetical protein